MSEYKLFAEILKMSDAKVWDEAVKEWSLVKIRYSKEPETCLCGHHPIKELCFIRNSVNGEVALVGNCCIKKFLGVDLSNVFISLSRGRVNMDVVEYCHEHGVINEWEHDFMRDIVRKCILSAKEDAKGKQIVCKIMSKLMGKP